MDHHFGMLDIDWAAEQPSVTMRIHDITGSNRIEHTVKISDLTFDAIQEKK